MDVVDLEDYSSMLDKADALRHIREVLDNLAFYLVRKDRPDYVIANFVDDVHNLNGLVQVLGYTCNKEEFEQALQSI